VSVHPWSCSKHFKEPPVDKQAIAFVCLSLIVGSCFCFPALPFPVSHTCASAVWRSLRIQLVSSLSRFLRKIIGGQSRRHLKWFKSRLKAMLERSRAAFTKVAINFGSMPIILRASLSSCLFLELHLYMERLYGALLIAVARGPVVSGNDND